MKILLVHQPYAQPGGEERLADTQETVLAARGHSVVRSGGRDVRALLERERFDVVHVHNQFLMARPAVYAAAHAAGVPVVQHLHNARAVCVQPFLVRDGHACTDCVGHAPLPGVVHRCYRDSFVLSAAAVALQVRQRRTWTRRVARFVAVSEAVAASVRAALPADRIVVCPNGLDVDPSPRDPAQDEGFALYVGRLSYEKGVDLLLDAAARRGEMRFAIVGEGPERAALERIAGANVTFLGRLDRAGVFDALARARVLVAPSRGQEPFGLGVAEAAALGVPALVTRVGGLPEVVGDGGVIVDPFDAAALATGLDAFADASAAHALGAAARRHYEMQFTPDAFADRLLSIYDAVLGGQAP
ncbi:MAG TPA: glycosyltransferase family 4 protein [Acidimicrobiales bacterium]|nr:glycosyltransferase family 4 protein [Acidimicrobiales bacterium]